MYSLTIPFGAIQEQSLQREHAPSRWQYAPRPRDVLLARVDVAPRLSFQTRHRGRYYIRDAVILRPTHLNERLTGVDLRVESVFERKDGAPLRRELLADHWQDFAKVNGRISTFLLYCLRSDYKLPKTLDFSPPAPPDYDYRYDPPPRGLAQLRYPTPADEPIAHGAWRITANHTNGARYVAAIHLPRRTPTSSANLLAGIHRLLEFHWHHLGWPAPYRPDAAVTLSLRRPYEIPGARSCDEPLPARP